MFVAFKPEGVIKPLRLSFHGIKSICPYWIRWSVYDSAITTQFYYLRNYFRSLEQKI